MHTSAARGVATRSASSNGASGWGGNCPSIRIKPTSVDGGGLNLENHGSNDCYGSDRGTSSRNRGDIYDVILTTFENPCCKKTNICLWVPLLFLPATLQEPRGDEMAEWLPTIGRKGTLWLLKAELTLIATSYRRRLQIPTHGSTPPPHGVHVEIPPWSILCDCSAQSDDSH